MEELLGLLGLGSGGLLLGQTFNQLGDVGDQGYQLGQDIADQSADMVDFKGYGVTGPSGTGNVDATGNTTLNLNPAQQQYADQNRDASLGFLASAMQDPSGMQQTIYDSLRATQRPEEQRQYLGLESRMAAQGRTGINTAAYGGTPESLAYHKAVQEAQNNASYKAYEYAMGQRVQDANLSSMFGQQQYLPQQALLDTMNTGSQAYGYEDIARRQGANLFSENAMTGLDALLSSRLGQANLTGQIGSGLTSGGFGLLSNAVSGGDTNILDYILSKF